MLSCELCNYIKILGKENSKGAKYFCEFTGYVFYKDIDDYEMKTHPCYGVKYHENLVKSEDLADDGIHVLKAV